MSELKKRILRQRVFWHPAAADDVSCSFLKAGFLLKKINVSFPLPERSDLRSFRLLFFTDTHIRTGYSRSYAPSLAWKGTEDLCRNLLEAEEMMQPDAVLFSGDLLGMHCCFEEGFSIFRRMQCQGKYAVYGNWDKRYKTQPCALWESMYHAAGVRLLVNSGVFLHNELYLYGFDDSRQGFPFLKSEPEFNGIRLLAAHNPDTATGRLTPNQFSGRDLFLCGHTHGGQLRIPGYGALRTSTVSGKSLENGFYEHENGARMLVSSGIGTTWIQRRLFAPPEIVCLELSF